MQLWNKVQCMVMLLLFDSVCVCCNVLWHDNVFVLLQSGWTPLHRAAWYNQIKCLKFLLDKGANIYSKDKVRY